MAALNQVQLEILKLFQHQQSEEELLELKKVLASYLSSKMIAEADKSFDEKGYTTKDLEDWKNEDFRNRKHS